MATFQIFLKKNLPGANPRQANLVRLDLVSEVEGTGVLGRDGGLLKSGGQPDVPYHGDVRIFNSLRSNDSGSH